MSAPIAEFEWPVTIAHGGQALQAERLTGSSFRPGVYSVLTSCALT